MSQLIACMCFIRMIIRWGSGVADGGGVSGVRAGFLVRSVLRVPGWPENFSGRAWPSRVEEGKGMTDWVERAANPRLRDVLSGGLGPVTVSHWGEWPLNSGTVMAVSTARGMLELPSLVPAARCSWCRTLSRGESRCHWCGAPCGG